MKGIALPVNIIIILLIALIVLGVVSVFVMTQISKGEIKGNVTYSYYSLCAAWSKTNCNTANAPGGMAKACHNAGLCPTETVCNSCSYACCGSDASP